MHGDQGTEGDMDPRTSLSLPQIQEALTVAALRNKELLDGTRITANPRAPLDPCSNKEGKSVEKEGRKSHNRRHGRKCPSRISQECCRPDVRPARTAGVAPVVCSYSQAVDKIP
jgi:hypothetical protein